jgi:hypothetical protein
MPFNRDEVEKLLADCQRRCCICHRFCGVKIETDHIVPAEEGGQDDIDNAIPVCFECHAEIHSYNDKHPRGRKYTPGELKLHKERWLRLCKEHPELALPSKRDDDVGPLQALIDELAYNVEVAKLPERQRGAAFMDEQFRRAIGEGAIALLEERLKSSILAAYVSLSRANQCVLAEVNQDGKERGPMGARSTAAREAVDDARKKLEAAYSELLRFLGRAEGA